MRPIESKDLNSLDNMLYELQQLTSLVGFMQTAYAEGDSAIDDADTSAALWHIYSRQKELIKQIKALYE